MTYLLKLLLSSPSLHNLGNIFLRLLISGCGVLFQSCVLWFLTRLKTKGRVRDVSSVSLNREVG